MEYMEFFSDDEPCNNYDIPIEDLLGSDGEGAKAKLQEDVELVAEAKVIKEEAKGKGKKIIMQRRVKVRPDAVREGEKSRVNEKWMIEEQNVSWGRMADGEQKKGAPMKKRKASDRDNGEENECWEGGNEEEEREEKDEKEEKEEKEEDEKKLFERRERNLQMCQKDCQVEIENA